MNGARRVSISKSITKVSHKSVWQNLGNMFCKIMQICFLIVPEHFTMSFALVPSSSRPSKATILGQI